MSNTHNVFNIQKFCMSDGPGIRTTVFLKGCPLGCLWCHNPESQSLHRQIMLNDELCTGCGKCASVCVSHTHSFDSSRVHTIDDTRCIGCSRCVDICKNEALELVGKEMSAGEIIEIAMQDYAFYKTSDGGITVSGGEPLLSPSFLKELCILAKKAGLHVCIETCGFAKWEDIEALLPYVDIFLWDFKEIDSERHKLYTSVSNDIILDNLKRLNSSGASIILRCPIVPGYNDREDRFKEIGRLADELDGVMHIELEPYHSFGEAKYKKLRRTYAPKSIALPSDETIANWISVISKSTKKSVIKI